MNLAQLLKKGKNYLQKNNIEDYSFDSFQLLLHAAKINSTDYYLHNQKTADDDIVLRYTTMIKQRAEGEPLQYIIGHWPFYDNDFIVGKGVLIPRPETEELVDISIKTIKDNNLKVIYDICAGTGCIGISIAKKIPDIKVFLFELYDEAIKYAKKNIENLNVKNVTLIRYDVLKGIPSDVPLPNMIISNPPYISTSEIIKLQKEVLKEPITALDGGSDGLLFYDKIFNEWISKLNDNVFIAMECGEDQAEIIKNKYSNICNLSAKKDFYGNYRFILGNNIIRRPAMKSQDEN